MKRLVSWFIARPFFLLISRLFDFTTETGNPISSAEVDAELDQIITLLAGNLDSTNSKPAAGYKGSQIATGNVDGIQTANLADGCVTDAKLASHGSNDAFRAVGRDHIKSQALSKDKLEIITYTHNAVITFTTGTLTMLVDTGLSSATYTPIAIYLTGTYTNTYLVPFIEVSGGKIQIRVHNVVTDVPKPAGSIPANIITIFALKNA